MRATALKYLDSNFVTLLVILALSVWFWSGIEVTPFHPDESTQIFMSSDWELFWQRPDQLFYADSPSDPLRQNYRLLDAPLTRLIIGAGRMISKEVSLPVDWDWSKSWQENTAAGAFPKTDLLIASRFSVAIFYPITLLLTYFCGKKFRGSLLGWIWMLLLAFNPLVLLHTRRAMAESLLLLTSVLFIWWMTFRQTNKWSLAIPTGLAFCVKQSAIGFILAGLIFVISSEKIESIKSKTKIGGVYLGLVGLLFICLNPVAWTNPAGTIGAAFSARAGLTSNQVTAFKNATPGVVMESILDKAAGLTGNLFIVPLQFHEIANYASETLPGEQSYLNTPLFNLFRGYIWGGVWIALLLIGLFLGFKTDNGKKGAVFWVNIAGIVEGFVILAGFSLPFQRYVIPLIPFTTLWIALTLSTFVTGARTYLHNKPVRTSKP